MENGSVRIEPGTHGVAQMHSSIYIESLQLMAFSVHVLLHTKMAF